MLCWEWIGGSLVAASYAREDLTVSELNKLKGTVESIAQSAKQTGGSLGQFRSRFSQHVSSVQGAIGGSSQRKDQEVIAVLQDAQKKVEAAAQALENAAKIASGYARSL